MALALERFDTPPTEVEQRRRAAIRSGRPQWLWPEVPKTQWRRSLSDIERAVRCVLTNGRAELPLTGDPLALSLACYTSGTGPLLGWWLERGILKAEISDASVLELHLRHNRRRVAKLQAITAKVGRALASRGVSAVVLKGMHTAAEYFPEPGTRPASDIDLLVSPDETKASEEVLGGLGLLATSRGEFESSWCSPSGSSQPRSLWLSHADDPWSIDLHHSLRVKAGARMKPVDLDFADPISSNRSLRDCLGLRTLQQPLRLHHLAVHASVGLQNLTMLRLIELHLVIRRDEAGGTLSWDAYLELARRTESLGYSYPALMMCEQLAPATVPETVLRQSHSHAPPALVSVLATLKPATAQRVDRNSVREHFMWAGDWRERLNQLAGDVVTAPPFTRLWSIYERRAWQLMRGGGMG